MNSHNHRGAMAESKPGFLESAEERIARSPHPDAIATDLEKAGLAYMVTASGLGPKPTVPDVPAPDEKAGVLKSAEDTIAESAHPDTPPAEGSFDFGSKPTPDSIPTPPVVVAPPVPTPAPDVVPAGIILPSDRLTRDTVIPIAGGMGTPPPEPYRPTYGPSTPPDRPPYGPPTPPYAPYRPDYGPARPPYTPPTPERGGDYERRAIEAINALVARDEGRAVERYRGLLGAARQWIDREGQRRQADTLDAVGQWSDNAKWKKWAKIGLKVAGGLGIAGAMVMTGGAGAILTPLLFTAGLREGVDGILQTVEQAGWGRKRTRAELGIQAQQTQRIDALKALVRERGTTLTEADFTTALNEMIDLERGVIDQQGVNTKSEQRWQVGRSIASTVVTLGAGAMGGIPLGTAEYAVRATGEATQVGATHLDAAHKVFWNLHGGQFWYNSPDEMMRVGGEAIKNGFPWTVLKGSWLGASHILGHGLPLAEKLGLAGAGAYQIARILEQFVPRKRKEASPQVPDYSVRESRPHGYYDRPTGPDDGTPPPPELGRISNLEPLRPPTETIRATLDRPRPDDDPIIHDIIEKFHVEPSPETVSALTNLLIDRGHTGERVFSPEFYESSPLVRGLARAREIVLIMDNYIGDAVLSTPIIDVLERYFSLRGEHKQLVIQTQNPELFKPYEERYPGIRIVKYGRELSPGEDQYIINMRKKDLLQAYSIEERRTQYISNPEYALSIDYSSWTQEAHPEHIMGGVGRRLYRTIPGMVARNLEVMLGTKLYDDLSHTQFEFPHSHNEYQRLESLRNKYSIDRPYVLISTGSSIRPKEYSPTRWKEVIQGLVETDGWDKQIVLLRPIYEDDARALETALQELPEETKRQLRLIREPLAQIPILISGADVAITPDTGIGHLAAELGTETIMMYSMANPVLWSAPSENMHRLATPNAQKLIRDGRPSDYRAWSSENQDRYITKYREGLDTLDPNRVIEATRRLLNNT